MGEIKKNKLSILENSLINKNKKLDEKYDSYFKDVKQANGQPLNDKKGGLAVLNRWDKKRISIHNAIIEVEKTKNAIEKEKIKINNKNSVYGLMPEYLQELIDNNTLKQWSKHPRILFVNGVEKARIYFDENTKICSHKYVSSIPNKEQYLIFRDVYNKIYQCQKNINKG